MLEEKDLIIVADKDGQVCFECPLENEKCSLGKDTLFNMLCSKYDKSKNMPFCYEHKIYLKAQVNKNFCTACMRELDRADKRSGICSECGTKIIKK